LATGPLAAPLNIDISKSYTNVPEVEKFKYWYGDVAYGFIVYLGTEDLAGFETELQLTTHSKKITSITLILGPAGIHGENCISQYRRVVKLLNSKYGHFKYRNIKKDPLIDDLVSANICNAIKAELYSVDTIWKVKGYSIKAVLLGDEIGFYIEIEYEFSSTIDHSLQQLKKAL